MTTDNTAALIKAAKEVLHAFPDSEYILGIMGVKAYLDPLRTAIATIEQQGEADTSQQVQGDVVAVKNCEYHAEQLKYVMAGGFSKEEQVLMLQNLFTAVDELAALPQQNDKAVVSELVEAAADMAESYGKIAFTIGNGGRPSHDTMMHMDDKLTVLRDVLSRFPQLRTGGDGNE